MNSQEYQKIYRLKNRIRLLSEKKKYYIKNREKMLLSAKKHRLAHAEEKKIYLRNYYSRKKAELLEKQRKYYFKNKVRISAINKIYAMKHKDKIRTYHRKWQQDKFSNDPNYREKYLRYVREHRRKKRTKLLLKKYKEIHRHKVNARNVLFKAVARGVINRPTACDNCGKICIPHGHHQDYQKPLKVNWLCSKCHAIIHHKH